MENEVRENVLDFIFAGVAEFSIVQDKTGTSEKHVVKYKVKKSYKSNKMFFVDTENLNGEMYYHGYYYVEDFGYMFRPPKTLKFPQELYNMDAVKALIWVVQRKGILPPAVHILHHGRCARCGRKLTDEESLRTGLGPECRRKVGLE